MYIHESHIRIRYSETDQMGYTYYGNYAAFYEVGRVEMLRSLGLTYRSFEENGIMMPVLELHCKFIKPARYDDKITVRTILKEAPAARIHFDYELYNEAGVLINTGHTKLVFIDMQTNRPRKPPADFMELLQPYFEQ
ncbi:acyl-CoA thioester hydrolase [Anseongella ginsenosidimutans]|uniref:Acyl-CoA thioester hydrolase n=1 Tax=Anseongella ginsenosidimutans TaxID=496056 RepID=A0A4R3KT38_9SPHI|nr:thioesterase family protein [Anseongella ginsenosidimutans]QEC53506.1 acyl-CoA thioesterase [Anseongella ginsenosidimutans]TCS88408.1 acyl-CoA thioester hydrolase [Anseongella ginsenosidimutans]